MLLALVSITDSITSFPLSFRTAITMASLCTSIPIYLTVVTHLSCLLGGRVFVLTLIFPPKAKMPFSRRLAYVLLQFFP